VVGNTCARHGSLTRTKSCYGDAIIASRNPSPEEPTVFVGWHSLSLAIVAIAQFCRTAKLEGYPPAPALRPLQSALVVPEQEPPQREPALRVRPGPKGKKSTKKSTLENVVPKTKKRKKVVAKTKQGSVVKKGTKKPPVPKKPARASSKAKTKKPAKSGKVHAKGKRKTAR
jgi:hypothetical protein